MQVARKNYITVLEDIKKTFDSFAIRFVLTDGLVLGYGRYKDLMDWDLDDIDIGVFHHISDNIKFQISKAFTFKSYQAPIFHIGRKRGVTCIRKYGVKIAIYWYELNGDYFDAVTYSGNRKRRWLAKWFLKPECVQFLNKEYYIPNDIDDYLTNAYGKDWKTNIIKDTAKWQQERIDNAASYPYPKYMPFRDTV